MGFVGKNLVTALLRRDDVAVSTCTRNDDQSMLEAALVQADIIFHLAGVNRPEHEQEFASGNTGLTQDIVQYLQEQGRFPKIILPSSTQAALDNPYGKSKKAAEDALLDYNSSTGGAVAVYRLPGVFGKWSQPNYNTVVATFCHNIARGLDISISNPEYELELVYIDDVVAEFLRHLDGHFDRQRYTVPRTFRVTLGDLAERIQQLHAIRESLMIPNLADDLTKCLYATYLSFVPDDNFSSPVLMHNDERGWLFELIKSEHFGQIFVSKTLPGITRGDHYHDTKLEKFCVIQGQGIIRFRHVHCNDIIEYPVNDTAITVVDIPPGYTHSIENNGNTEMICLFWANQVFNPEAPDTFWEKVKG
ncbi:MAG: SDR family oxidoreductase [Candidatus Electrothrix sp. AR3]|nr:SDR family oxidoreductase [Candidatus Electrothrix sp. AR3]